MAPQAHGPAPSRQQIRILLSLWALACGNGMIGRACRALSGRSHPSRGVIFFQTAGARPAAAFGQPVPPAQTKAPILAGHQDRDPNSFNAEQRWGHAKVFSPSPPPAHGTVKSPAGLRAITPPWADFPWFFDFFRLSPSAHKARPGPDRKRRAPLFLPLSARSGERFGSPAPARQFFFLGSCSRAGCALRAPVLAPSASTPLGAPLGTRDSGPTGVASAGTQIHESCAQAP